jgi:hypothetical protein
LLASVCCFAQQTTVNGKITDAETRQPLPMVSITFANTHKGTSTDNEGKFTLSSPGSFSHIVISAIGYQSLIKIIEPGAVNEVQVKLEKSQTRLKEVAINARSAKRYRNKDNPAVELIRRVIAYKDTNRAQRTNYLQFDQYERIGLTFFDIPHLLVNNFLFRPYRFMLDTVGGKLAAEVYLSEKQYRWYLRKEPVKAIKILEAQKENNIVKFIDTAGVNVYLNRLYGDQIDIYENNIFIINNQL